MDANRFDRLTRSLSDATSRRGTIKVAAGGALAAAGMGALGSTVFGQDVTTESKGFKGDDCSSDNDCRRGLFCASSGTCKYTRNCGGKKNDACQGTAQCCKNRNLRCINRKCRRRN
jgi:hypothetical protein